MIEVMHGFRKLQRLLLVGLISLSVLSCGSDSGGVSGTGITAGISGTGITFGAITGFGSVFVNGVRYEIDDAIFDVDGDTNTSQDNLRIGMVVRLEYTAFDDGTFAADSLVYDDSIEGPITAAPVQGVSADEKTFSVMGTNVVVNVSTTSFHDSSSIVPAVDFDNLKAGDVIEVSGFVIDASGTIQATLVEKKGEQVASGGNPPPQVPVELHVTIPAPDPNGSFIVNGITVNYDVNGITTEFDDLPAGGPVAGLNVEVKGLYDAISNTIQASEIEGEDGVIGSNDTSGPDGDTGAGTGDDSPLSFSLQGFIVGFDGVNFTFSINGVAVAVQTSFVPQDILNALEEGLQVEVEGVLENNVLLADQVEIREGKSKYQAGVNAVDATARTISIGYPGVAGEIVLKLDNQSILEDEDHNPIDLLDIIAGTDDVKILAREIDGEHFIVSLQRERFTNISYEISDAVDDFTATSITMDGLIFQLDANVLVFGVPLVGSPAIAIGDTLELEDDDRNGSIDEVSLYFPG